MKGPNPGCSRAGGCPFHWPARSQSGPKSSLPNGHWEARQAREGRSRGLGVAGKRWHGASEGGSGGWGGQGRARREVAGLALARGEGPPGCPCCFRRRLKPLEAMNSLSCFPAGLPRGLLMAAGASGRTSREVLEHRRGVDVVLEDGVVVAVWLNGCKFREHLARASSDTQSQRVTASRSNVSGDSGEFLQAVSQSNTCSGQQKIFFPPPKGQGQVQRTGESTQGQLI